MTYIRTAAPAAEALTLAQVKLHLKLDTDDDDDLLQGLISTARDHLEKTTGLCLMTQGWLLSVDSLPEDGVIQIARGPVQAIQNLTLYNPSGEPSELSLEGHVLDGAARPARLLLPPAGDFVSANLRAINGIEIDFIAGFGDTAAEVPDALKRAMLTHIAAMHACRGVVTPDDQPAVVPPGYDRLIAPFLMRRF